MQAPRVYSLPIEDLEPFLDRRRYSAFAVSQLAVTSFLGEILSKANDFVPSNSGSILMDRPFDRGETAAETSLYFVATFGPSAQSILGRHLRADRGVAGYVYRTGEPYLMNDPANDPNFYSKFDEGTDFTTSCAIAVPVRIERTVCGVLELVNRLGDGGYSERDLQMLEIFARYTSVSIENLLDAQRANEMARRDDLTGLYNDRFFHHRLTEDLVRADVTDGTVALLFLDLDNFKAVNDNHGHLAGSQVLKEFGYLLRQTVADEGATLARYGGDEFVVILPGHDLDRARATAADIQIALTRTQFLQGSFSWSEGPVYWRQPLTCSIGVAVYPVHLPRQGTTDMKKNLLLRAADLAMYDAKAAGKNQVRVAS
ncbi:MAG: sensor domain-containing diguanylate cyclase [Thermoanaerobaculales bacterium]|jgi:diguanylate cyclase (GGDEF)-like protein|nr:sensor domain-containing diguanylate cyclase [Thermoanaerobaculales bacterium]